MVPYAVRWMVSGELPPPLVLVMPLPPVPVLTTVNAVRAWFNPVGEPTAATVTVGVSEQPLKVGALLTLEQLFMAICTWTCRDAAAPTSEPGPLILLTAPEVPVWNVVVPAPTAPVMMLMGWGAET